MCQAKKRKRWLRKLRKVGSSIQEYQQKVAELMSRIEEKMKEMNSKKVSCYQNRKKGRECKTRSWKL
jgi:hypothetical protein